jgi:ligand-binding SRPBCC domain-containing protein
MMVGKEPFINTQERGTVFILRESIEVAAPLERIFLLSTSLAIVERELGMHPVPAEYIDEQGQRRTTRTSGLITGGERVRWEGWQLGLWHYHVSLIAPFEPYSFFSDRMVAGRFQSFEHDHSFTPTQNGVRLDDEIRFSLPLGPLGDIAGRLVLAPHIRGLMRRRFRLLKQIAESNECREYLQQ